MPQKKRPQEKRPQEKRASWTTYAVVALTSATIGFLAIYAIVGHSGGAPDATDSQQAYTRSHDRSNEAASYVQAGGSGKLNTGKMTAFVFRQDPGRLPDVKFNNVAGEQISLKSFAGKVILLNLWATWCAPCLEEMPHLDELQAILGGDAFEVVAVSLDRGSPEKPLKFLKGIKSRALNFYHDPTAELGFALKTIGMPTTFLIDTEGREIGRLVGPAEWHSPDAVRLIEAYLPATGN